MVRRVLDTNVVVKWFFQEEGSDRAQIFLEELERGEGRVIVPSSIFHEASNVFWTKRRLGVTEENAQRLWRELIRLPLEVVNGFDFLPQAMTFSFHYDVSPYDAVFVVVARNMDCDLITDDHVLWEKVQSSCAWVKLL
ncbi:MAG TPA: type II toxin-antitoxin system VapC family toxin [Thermoanaerobaculia bacterium]